MFIYGKSKSHVFLVQLIIIVVVVTLNIFSINFSHLTVSNLPQLLTPTNFPGYFKIQKNIYWLMVWRCYNPGIPILLKMDSLKVRPVTFKIQKIIFTSKVSKYLAYLMNVRIQILNVQLSVSSEYQTFKCLVIE